MSRSPTTEQITDRIEAARKLLRPRPVKLNKYPRWLLRRVRALGECHRPLPIEFIARGQIQTMAVWLDHCGTSDDDSRESFVSEPYRFASLDARELDSFCEALGLTWYLSSNSWWYPGRTVRIVIHEPMKVDP